MAPTLGTLSRIFLLFLLFRDSRAVAVQRSVRTPFPRAVSVRSSGNFRSICRSSFLSLSDRPPICQDVKEAILKGLGSREDGLGLSGFDPRDAKIGTTMAYEFHVEIDKKIFPIKLLEDVSRWEFVDFAFLAKDGGESGLADMEEVSFPRVSPVLPPFQIAGPTELWIQDGDDVRLALPVSKNFSSRFPAILFLTKIILCLYM